MAVDESQSKIRQSWKSGTIVNKNLIQIPGTLVPGFKLPGREFFCGAEKQR